MNLAAYTSSSQVRNALNTGVLTLAEALEAQDHVKFQTGSWVPGCGGSETPFKFEGQTYLYCWHTRTGEHAYIHLESDRPMPRDWHPGARA